MKKGFLLTLATAFMAFAGCQNNELEAPITPNEGGSSFELIADIVQTKTTLDAVNYKVDWEEGDIIYMVTSNGTWGAPYNDDTEANTIAEFTYADGKFTSAATIVDGEYTFKAMYAVPSNKSYHRGASSSHKLEATQEQNCTNRTGHIEKYDALVGTFTATVPAAEKATVAMSHLYTLMQVNVKNNTGDPIQVTKFEMSADSAEETDPALAGVFYIDAFDTPAISTKNSPSSTITVNVTGGNVAAGESLPVYFVMAPLSKFVGDITFKVTDAEKKTYTKKVTMTDAISFAAGTYNTTPYTISTADEVKPEPEGQGTATLTFDDKAKRTEYSTSIQVWEENGIKLTNDKGSSTTNVGDYAEPARFYKNSTITIEAPGNILKLVFDCKGIESKYVTPISALPGAEADDNIVTIELDGNSDKVDYILNEGQGRVNSLTVTYSNSGETPEPDEPEGDKPVISVSKLFEVGAIGGNIEIPVTISNPVQGINPTAAVDVDWISINTTTKSYIRGSFEFKVDENTSAESRTGVITLSYEGAESVDVTIIQAGVEVETDEPQVVTVADFLAAEVNDNVFYRLQGTITSVANTTYGNFDLTDDTGTVYIYGLVSEDGATDKYWAASGAELGDDIVISVVRSDFNGTAQGKNARFIELKSPGTRAFYTLSREAVDFTSGGGQQVVTVTTYNTTEAVTASSDNAKFTVSVNNKDVTISSSANEVEEAVSGNITIKVGNLNPKTVKVTLAAKPASGVVEGGQDDFHSISATNTSYVTGKTTAGWNYKNCAIFKGGSSDSSPAFKMIGDASNRALCMNGKTSAVGSITSPTLTTGCGTLKFNYGLPFSDTKIKFRVDIKQNGSVVKTFTIDKSSAAKYTKYSHEEVINVSGDFQIVFTNLSPSNSTSNKDRTAVWDIEWTGYKN